VADFFCGSGTTAVVSARLGRGYVATDLSFRAVHTTRTRLIQAGSPPFSLQHLKGSDPEIIDRDLSASLRLERDGQVVRLVAHHPEDIDYWEVDPGWDGLIFRSAYQAIRPRKKGVITDRLAIQSSSNSEVCARVVDIHGRRGWLKR